MQKYIGRFRVKSATDREGNFTDNIDDTYVCCKNGIEMYRYDENVLALYVPNSQTASKLFNELQKYLTDNTIKKLNYEIKHNVSGKLSGEHVMYFYEQYIDKVSKIVEPRTGGASINPRSKKNIAKNTEKNIYIAKNPELILEFKKAVKEIVDKNNGEIYIYKKIYSWIEKEMRLENVEGINLIEKLDKSDLLKEAIDLLDVYQYINFKNST